MEPKKFLELVGLCEDAGLPLIDVCDDIKRNLAKSPDRDRIISNIERIREAILEIPSDYSKIVNGKPEAVSKLEYEMKLPKRMSS